MHFAPKHSFYPWVSKEEHFVACVIITCLINVVLTVFLVARLFESKAFHLAILSVNRYSFIQWSGREDIFHPSYELELVIIKLLNVTDRDRRESRLLIILE